MPLNRFQCFTLAASVLFLLAGCGRSDSQPRYNVSGSVTFAGEPVPAGFILFTPDAAKGARGPAGSAQIKDGQYDTRHEGKGPVGGPHTVTITGFDGRPADKEGFAPDGKSLFSGYTISVDLPHEKTTQDFAVPASAGHGPASSAVVR